MNRQTIAFMIVLLLLGASAVLADDFSPAPWRGQPLTVAAEWEFINPDLTDLPPDYFNNIGDGVHEWLDCYVHTHPQNVYWEEDPADPNDGRAVTAEVPGQLLFFLCNWIDDYEYKYIWVQITYGGEGVPYIYEVVAPNEATNDWPDPVMGQPEDVGGLPGYAVEFWVLPYNPDREYVNMEIPPNTWVDQVWIETISTREPIATEKSSWGRVKSLYR
jgi:hypothetical protein